MHRWCIGAYLYDIFEYIYICNIRICIAALLVDRLSLTAYSNMLDFNQWKCALGSSCKWRGLPTCIIVWLQMLCHTTCWTRSCSYSLHYTYICAHALPRKSHGVYRSTYTAVSNVSICQFPFIRKPTAFQHISEIKLSLEIFAICSSREHWI